MLDTAAMRAEAKATYEAAMAEADRLDIERAENAKQAAMIADAGRRLEACNNLVTVYGEFIPKTLVKNIVKGEIPRLQRVLAGHKPRKSRPKPAKPRKKTVHYKGKDYNHSSMLDLSMTIRNLTGIRTDDGQIQAWFAKHPEGDYQECFDELTA
ncbi:MAG TPA: hypothetical protein VNS32_27590 [Flavisolibacter sp.]|nr:hypothetical protein [Flavisolibacter sp.]